MPELQQYEYRDLINVRKEILHRFEWVSRELEQIIESLQARRLSVADAQQRIDQPLVKEVTLTARDAFSFFTGASPLRIDRFTC
jgi:hypothetical protein